MKTERSLQCVEKLLWIFLELTYKDTKFLYFPDLKLENFLLCNNLLFCHQASLHIIEFYLIVPRKRFRRNCQSKESTNENPYRRSPFLITMVRSSAREYKRLLLLVHCLNSWFVNLQVLWINHLLYELWGEVRWNVWYLIDLYLCIYRSTKVF